MSFEQQALKLPRLNFLWLLFFKGNEGLSLVVVLILKFVHSFQVFLLIDLHCLWSWFI